jgi:hypothetical protein
MDIIVVVVNLKSHFTYHLYFYYKALRILFFSRFSLLRARSRSKTLNFQREGYEKEEKKSLKIIIARAQHLIAQNKL